MIGIHPDICWKIQLAEKLKMFVYLRHFFSSVFVLVLFCNRQASICRHETL